MEYKVYEDSLGKVKVPAGKMWGAQTQRAVENFAIGDQSLPLHFIYEYVRLKRFAACANHALGTLSSGHMELITGACDAVLEGKYDEHFPLLVWHSGSGTQTNMNVNEVIANIANAKAGEVRLHPNDHINMSQSSNDTFPTVMHMSIVRQTKEHLLPALKRLRRSLKQKQEQYMQTFKVGRTHLQDALPMSFGQEVSGWVSMLQSDKKAIKQGVKSCMKLPVGGSAVGTGANVPKGFNELMIEYIAQDLNAPCKAQNSFHGLSSHDLAMRLHGDLTTLATNLHKIANDIRWLASGPRCGLGELRLSANEPGSSIMPGKVNPTQAEAVTMVCAQVIGNNAAVGFANAQGNFELNVYKPVIIYNLLQSIALLADAMDSFEQRCVWGMEADDASMQGYLDRSLMLVTALVPHIGYDKSAKVAKNAYDKGITLSQSIQELGYMEKEEFERLIDIKRLVFQY